MIYRPPLLKRWRYPFQLCLAFAILWVGTLLLFSIRKTGETGIIFLVATGIWILDLIRRSWLVWTTSVSVDDAGLRWARGSAGGALRWDEISELGFSYTEARRRLLIGPVRSVSKMLHPLPLLPRGLYEELKKPLGGLPPSIEQDYYSRQSS